MNVPRSLCLALAAVLACSAASAQAASSGGSGGPTTDREFQRFSGSRYTSQYHIYAAGLDWSKPVGMLIYADGSGEYGLKNPDSNYLLSGRDGLVNVARRNNMILLTPFSPNTNCSDGDGSCWYLGDSVGYAKWAEELVLHVQSQYPVERDRIAFGGYSSGAQLATEFWTPSGAAHRTMTDGVVVAISYGGSPKMNESAYPEAFRSRVHMNWNVGSRDSAYTTNSAYGVKAGYNQFTGKGFATSLDVIEGMGHSRSDFGKVMEVQIQEHVPTSGSAPPDPPPVDPPPVDPPPGGFHTTVTPTRGGARFLVDVPRGMRAPTYVYVFWDDDNYEYFYSYRTGDDVPFVFNHLPRREAMVYEVWSDEVKRAEGAFRTR